MQVVRIGRKRVAVSKGRFVFWALLIWSTLMVLIFYSVMVTLFGRPGEVRVRIYALPEQQNLRFNGVLLKGETVDFDNPNFEPKLRYRSFAKTGLNRLSWTEGGDTFEVLLDFAPSEFMDSGAMVSVERPAWREASYSGGNLVYWMERDRFTVAANFRNGQPIQVVSWEEIHRLRRENEDTEPESERDSEPVGAEREEKPS